MAALSAVRSLDLPDCWIGAGFARDTAWDHLHGRPPVAPHCDLDVIWFDRDDAALETDAALEARLGAAMPEPDWSVKNQARMHARNGDRPYRSAADAMRFWPETATAVALRISAAGEIEINAPFGLEDLFRLRLVPTRGFTVRKRAIFEHRISSKGWMTRYPRLHIVERPRALRKPSRAARPDR